ncbi:MAG: hypothetical protein Q8K70_00895 [Bacteroidota bacterium]|nr:hypothetical protein [Bacteroidota bacterium]
MKPKIKAFELFKNGFSYSEIALELSISKSTAHKYVQEMKSLDSLHSRTNVPNSNDKAFSVRSDIKNNKLKEEETLEKRFKKKEFIGDEFLKVKFITYKFTGKFLELIGKPSKPFYGIIWGLPKGGKSNLTIRFADYLKEYFGTVCYIAVEEGKSVTLQLKIKEIGGSKVTFVELKDKNEIRDYLNYKKFDFIFIDSINSAGIDNDFLELLKSESPKSSFISVVQATKTGNFKGDQALTHNCDFIIKVVLGIAYHEGRFNTNSEISIFDSPLYEKNPNKETEKVLDTFKHEKEKTKPDSEITTKDTKALSLGLILGRIVAEDVLKNNKTIAFIESLKKNKL